MRKFLCRILASFACVYICLPVLAQEINDTSTHVISIDYLHKVSTKAKKLDEKLGQHAEKAIDKLQKQEARIKRKLSKIDSLAASNIFADADNKYRQLSQRLTSGTSSSYIPKLDTLLTSIKFLEQNPQLLSQAKEAKVKLDNALSEVKGLKEQFNKAEVVRKFLKERKQFLKDQLGKLGFAKELKKINKEVYYYSQQVNEYKELLKDSKKAERKALELLSKSKFFRDFMRKNSELASLFRTPSDPNDPAISASLAGLQTRAQVNSLLQQQLSDPAAREQFRQNMQDAQSQLNALKSKVNQLGGGTSDMNMPDFKPNQQKTKSFLQRLEYGTNVQTQRATNFFPVTSDIGLSLGYKLNDKSIIGVGSSFKMGWGTGFNNMRISSQGVGLRSFIDYKIKGSFWISGGYEMNYKSMINNFSQLENISEWQQSGLVGLSKVISLKTKFFKKTKVQLLWDFLSSQQVPATQAIVFRVGYSF